MCDRPQPWRDHKALIALARDWDRRFAGRRIDRIGGGHGWLRLTLIDAREDSDPPAHCFLMALAGAMVVWDADRSPPPVVLDALERVPQQRLTAADPLLGATLTRVSVPPADKILALTFRRKDGSPLYLLHQLFGPRGNLVLLEDNGERIWSTHGSPHPAVLSPPRESAPPVETVGVAALFRDNAVEHLIQVLIANSRNRMAGDLKRALDSSTRLESNLARDLAGAENGDHWRHCGETLAIHLHSLRNGLESVDLVDAEGETLSIPLDPRLPPHANMETCFKKARKAERGRDTIAERLEDVQMRLAELNDAAAELEATSGTEVESLQQLLDWRERHVELLPRRSAKGKRVPVRDVTEPFRRFVVDEKWHVWVGRSNVENDELTHRASHVKDLWFHAQGVPGSHVILRTGGRPDLVPKGVLEKAAAIAAWYSKSRTSGLVPVIYAERRYVRKPRKAKPGLAATLRHESMMIEPGLPDQP
jgi:predicted ribosome quality control (RQC) complex YloA/Tae2 family protein